MKSAQAHPARIAAGSGLLLLMLMGASESRAQSNTPIDSFWVTDGIVYQIVPSGGKVFIGGAFTVVGPRTGGAAAIDTASGTADPAFPKVEGSVSAIAPDGAGGWFLGGSFTRVGGATRSNLAHVLGDGRVSAWNPTANGTVSALVVAGNTVYVGGAFTAIGATPRNRLAAIDTASGSPTGWNPDADAQVLALAVSGGTVYAGGVFTTVGSLPRNRVAALSAASGAPTSWDPSSNGVVRALAVSGPTVYAGGDFTNIGGLARNRIAALDSGTGTAIIGWDPSANATVYALAPSGGLVYAAGAFLTIGGLPRNRLAALDAVTGLATSWNPDLNSDAFALALSGGVVYVAGGFTAVGGIARNNLAAIDTSTGVATTWAPQANGLALALGLSGNTLCAGGQFSSAGGSIRNRLASFDEATGSLDPWNPDANGDVRALALSSGTVYAGGLFTSVGAVARSRIAALDASTGSSTPWNPGADNDVLALAASGGTVYTGGDFINIGGQIHPRIVALDASTALPTGWSPNANNTVQALAVTGGAVYAGGFFSIIGGQTRNEIAAIDTATGSATSWNPSANNFISALLPSGGLVYTGGGFTTIGGQTRNFLAALDTAGNATIWNPNPNGQVRALALSGSTLFVGGTFTSMGGLTRNRIAAVDSGTGAVGAWNPDSSGAVFAVAESNGKVYAGGGFSTIGGQPRRGFAAFCLADAPTGLSATPVAPNQIDLTWTPTAASSYNVYRSRTAGGPYQFLASTATTIYSDTTAQVNVTYFYVVRAVDQCESDPSNEAMASTTTGGCNLPPDFDGAAWAVQVAGSTCSIQVGWAPGSVPCGVGVFYSVYRDTNPLFTPSVSNRIATLTSATTYTDTAALSPGTTYYYIVRATSLANGKEDLNEIRHPATPTACTAGGPDTVQFFTVISKDKKNILEWQYPPGPSTVFLKIHRVASPPPCPPIFPTDLGSLLTPDSGMASQYDSFIDDNGGSGLLNGANYCYAIFVDKGSGTFSAGRFNTGRPFDTAGQVKWASNLGIMVAPPGIGLGAIHVAANDGTLRSMEKGAGLTGGLKPPSWKHVAVSGPSQGRPSTVVLPVLSAQRVVLLGSQGGSVYAINADSGEVVWSRALTPPMVQAAPSGIFASFAPQFGISIAYSYILVGTRDGSSANRFHALQYGDGFPPAGPWPVTGAPFGPIGIISSQAAVDYPNKRVYFTSHRFSGAGNTVWCVNLDTGAVIWAQDHGDIEASPTLRGNRLYVGNTSGDVKALDSGDGTAVWTFPTGEIGGIKGFVMTNQSGSDLYFSTTNKVWALNDGGASPSPNLLWGPTGDKSLPAATTPVLHQIPGYLYVGTGDGKLHRFNASDGSESFPFPLTLGEPGSSGVGSPTIDARQGFLYVGSDAGIVYAIQLP